MENPQEELCTKCQKPLLPGARFCGSCGKVDPIEPELEPELEPETVPAPVSTTTPDGGSRIGFIIILVIIIGFIWCNNIAQRRSSDQAASVTAAPVTTNTSIPIPIPTPTPQPQTGNVTINENSGKTSKELIPVVAEPRVITEAYLLSITEKTLQKCNRSGVKRAQWARIKASSDGPVYEIHFAADDNFSHRAIRDIAALKAFSLLKGIRDVTDLGSLKRVVISATFSSADKNGNSSEDDIMIFEFSRSTLSQLNWDKIEVSDQVFKAADRVWISPVVAD